MSGTLESAKERLDSILARLEIQEDLQRMAAHDLSTQLHMISISQFAGALAERLGESNASIEFIMTAALLHDIGKMIVPSWILQAPRRLTEKEWAMMQTHSVLGEAHLRRAGEPELARIVLQHHEKIDGTGYPHQIRGREIAHETQIVSIADFWDAVRFRRIYRNHRHSTEQTVQMIEERAGSHFNPDMVQVAAKMFREIPDAEASDSHVHVLR